MGRRQHLSTGKGGRLTVVVVEVVTVVEVVLV